MKTHFISQFQRTTTKLLQLALMKYAFIFSFGFNKSQLSSKWENTFNSLDFDTKQLDQKIILFQIHTPSSVFTTKESKFLSNNDKKYTVDGYIYSMDSLSFLEKNTKKIIEKEVYPFPCQIFYGLLNKAPPLI